MAFVRSFASLTPSTRTPSVRASSPHGRLAPRETDRPRTAASFDGYAMAANPVSAPIGHGGHASDVLLRGFLVSLSDGNA